jgi:uncharacterized protein (TIGR04255 family)
VPIAVERQTLEHLDDAPLRLALVQVRYAPVHAVEKRERVADFQALLGDEFVAEEPQRSQGLLVQFGPAAAPPVLPPAETVWPFRDPKRGFGVSLSSTSLALEATAGYHDFPVFLEEFRTTLAGLVDVFHPKVCTRLGVRYVNEIGDPRLTSPDGLAAFLNRELVSPVGSDLGSDLMSSLSELRFREDDGVFVLRHGLVESTKYLLDFDRFSETHRSFALEALVDTTSKFHDLIESVFVWSLSDEYLSGLKGGA